VYQVDFADFNETEFEEFCFELLKGLPGFHNVDWRKGTPKSSSPADRGRDIAAEVDHVDVDGARHQRKRMLVKGCREVFALSCDVGSGLVVLLRLMPVCRLACLRAGVGAWLRAC